MKTERQTFPKTTCCISGCARWSRKFEPGEEWICGRHWRAAPARCRRALRKVWRDLSDAYSRWNGNQATKEVYLLTRRLERLSCRLWAHMRRRVCLAEAGL